MTALATSPRSGNLPAFVARSPLLARALAIAAWAHRGAGRTSAPKPYVEHCVEVAEILEAYGVTDERTLAVALLHDVLEDTPVTAAELADVMPPDVVAAVQLLTEGPEPDHAARKAAHLARLRSAPEPALAVFAADKLAGARDLAVRLEAGETSGWPDLNAPLGDKIAVLRAAAELAAEAPDPAGRILVALGLALDALESGQPPDRRRSGEGDAPRDLHAYEEAARRRLPQQAFDWVDAGAGSGGTVTANLAAWAAIELWPSRPAAAGEPVTAVEVLGASLRAPVLPAPMGRHGLVHPDGELASAEAAARAGSALCVGMRSTTDLRAVAAAASCPLWFGLYIAEDRDYTAEVVRAAAAHGYRRIILTVDRQVRAPRPRADRHGPLRLPAGVEVASHVDGYPNDLPWDPNVTWEDVAWVAGLGLPVTVKGVLRPQDALRALDSGADSVVVSNHGGRQLDGAVPTAVALRQVVAELRERAPVLVDGGVRTGVDVFRALALGARAVLVGRPFAWGLAAGGAAGAAGVLQALEGELRQAMWQMGCATVADIDPGMIRIPAVGAPRP